MTFVLPNVQHEPSGGPRVVYEYANGLVARGYDVTVVHLHLRASGRADWLRHRVRSARSRARARSLRTGPHWISRHPQVKMVYLPTLTDAAAAEALPAADFLVATFWTTWAPIALAPPSSGRKLQLVQAYEVWGGTKEAVDAVLLAPGPKVVVAYSLRDTLIEVGVRPELISVALNGVDHDLFRPRTPPDVRPPRVAFMAHTERRKGLDIAIAVLERVRRARPDVTAVAYGIVRRPRVLPRWIDYVRLPTPEQLAQEVLNSASVFLCPSRHEGWGLPVTEAMAAGCGIVSTRNGGVESYAIDGVNALLRDVDDIDGLTEAVADLLDDRELRLRLVEAAYETVAKFSWPASVDAFEAALMSLCDEAPR